MPATSGAAPVDSRPSVEHGLLCVFEDPARPEGERRRFTWLDFRALRPDAYLKKEPKVQFDSAEGRLSIEFAADNLRRLPMLLDEKGNPLGRGSRVHWNWEMSNDEDVAAAAKTVDGLLTESSSPIKLSAEGLGTKERRPLLLFLDVDQYPRAFVYEVQRDDTSAQRFEPRWKQEYYGAKIASPENGQAFQNVKSIKIKVIADGPTAGFTSDNPLEVYIQPLVGDSGGNAKAVFRADRVASIRWSPPAANGEISVETSIGELEADLDVGAFPNQRIRIVAAFRGNEAQDEITIVQDQVPPLVAYAGDDAVPYEPGGLVPLDVADAELSGVAKVRFLGDWTSPEWKAEMATEIIPPEPGDAWRIPLPSKDLAVGRHTIFVRATDFAGNESKLTKFAISVKAPKPPETTPITPTTVKISGTVSFSGEPTKGCKVTLEGARNAETTTKDDGSFEFPGLPKGEYTVRATAVINVKRRNAQASVIVSDTSKDPAPLKLKL